MRESDTAIRRHVTKPRVFHEAIHFRAPQGTKQRIDALRGDLRQGDFVRMLLEEALERREAHQLVGSTIGNKSDDGVHTRELEERRARFAAPMAARKDAK